MMGGLQLTVLGESGRRYLVLPARERRDIIFLQTKQGQSYVLQLKQTVRRCKECLPAHRRTAGLACADALSRQSVSLHTRGMS